MSEYDQPEVPVTAHGAQVRANWLAGLQRSADMMDEMLSGAGRAGHAATSRQLRAAYEGLFADATPQEMATAVAERPAVVGSAYGGRPLERNGGLYDHHVSAPHPMSHDLRYVNQVGGPPAADAESGLARWTRENR